jgi:hypothetical protein
MDLFVVPIGFKLLLYGVLIVRIDRRDLVWINVTTNPTAEWIARQTTEAFPWDDAPGYMIRDRDCIYGAVVTSLTPIGSCFLGIGPSGSIQFGHPPSVDIASIRLIGRLVGRCLGSRRQYDCLFEWGDAMPRTPEGGSDACFGLGGFDDRGGFHGNADSGPDVRSGLSGLPARVR